MRTCWTQSRTGALGHLEKWEGARPCRPSAGRKAAAGQGRAARLPPCPSASRRADTDPPNWRPVPPAFARVLARVPARATALLSPPCNLQGLPQGQGVRQQQQPRGPGWAKLTPAPSRGHSLPLGVLRALALGRAPAITPGEAKVDGLPPTQAQPRAPLRTHLWGCWSSLAHRNLPALSPFPVWPAPGPALGQSCNQLVPLSPGAVLLSTDPRGPGCVPRNPPLACLCGPQPQGPQMALHWVQ